MIDLHIDLKPSKDEEDEPADPAEIPAKPNPYLITPSKNNGNASSVRDNNNGGRTGSPSLLHHNKMEAAMTSPQKSKTGLKGGTFLKAA